jgi:hypothetical protein
MYSVVFFHGATPVVCAAMSGEPRTLAMRKRAFFERAETSSDDDVAAAVERGRMRLLEDYVANAQQRRHHRNAESEAAREDCRADRSSGQRPQGQAQNHDAVTTRPLFIAR